MGRDTDLQRRVSRLENDTEALYELVTEVRVTQHEHTQKFVAIDQRLERVDQRLERVDQRLERVDQRLDGVDQRLELVDQSLRSIQATLIEVVRRLPESA